MLSLLLTNLLVTIAALTILWLVSIPLRDTSIIDPCWGLGFSLIAWLTLWQSSPRGIGALLLVALTTLWGGRLALYLLLRNRGHGEDRRYASLRNSFGPSFWWISYPVVFLLQGLLMWIVSFPVQIGIAASADRSPGFLSLLGLILFLVGFTFETLGDWQLARFKRNPQNRNRVMDRGLWRYTRHPNYFGDFTLWWGLYLIACDFGAYWTIFSPLLMSFLLLRVSGVTLLERDISERRPDYLAYRRRTNAFFPGKPRD